jgi:hypothetical protein
MGLVPYSLLDPDVAGSNLGKTVHHLSLRTTYYSMNPDLVGQKMTYPIRPGTLIKIIESFFSIRAPCN